MDNETVIKRGCTELILSYGESLLMNIKPDKKLFNMKIDKEELIRYKKENSYLISLLDNLIRKSTRCLCYTKSTPVFQLKNPPL
ncbi:hypothetical protein [Thermoanaerobacterium thermosaccharolyticum]|uniref:hypothetical protein n=1 Tax=Thermoanaerobacterium thermosaccharolyticum TaxID=1517 RepID=UPI002FDAD6BC